MFVHKPKDLTLHTPHPLLSAEKTAILLIEKSFQWIFKDPVIENIMMDIFRRKLKNRVVIVPQVPPSLNHPLVMTEQERHISGHSIKTAIGKSVSCYQKLRAQ